MKIALGCDHGGYELKEFIKRVLERLEYSYEDFGCNSTESCDYPNFGAAAARAVAEGKCQRGIVICTTGIGISIAANKIKGIRAVTVSDCFTARAVRMHNDANVLCMGARVIGSGLACLIAQLFVETEFEGGRHQTRLDMIADIENGK